MIKILTDTTVSLTRDEYQEYSITPLPLYLYGDQGMQKDLFEILPEEFYRQQRNGIKYSTSHLSPEVFTEIFKPVVKAGNEIICILLSSKISPCVTAALQAATTVDPDKISIVDSRQSGYGQAYMALKAREMSETGATRPEIIAALENIRSRTHTYFLLESLEHLKSGGRFFWDQALIATVLRIKPIIWFDQSGKMKLHNKISSIRGVRDKILDLIRECAKRGVEKLVLHYADNYQEAVSYAKELEEIAKQEVPLIKLSPVVGAHTGPDLLGPCIVTKR